MADDQVNGREPVVPSAQQDHEMNAVHSVESPALPTIEQDDQVDTSETPSQDQVNTEPLRIANPLPESDSEEEIEDLTPPEPIAVPAPLVRRNYQRDALLQLEYFTLNALLFIHYLWTLLNRAGSITQKLSLGVVRTLQTQLYVFFQDTPYPYRAQTTTLAGPGIPAIEWYYNADTKVFLSSNLYNTTNEYHTHHFEWLSGEIKYNDLVLYDVSEFLQQAKWAGANRPSPSVILAAWSIHSGIVLNLSDSLVLKTINEDGSESTLQLRG